MTVGLVRALRCTKYNMLRGRVDACAYDTEQLLLGTLFFTLLCFLLPTVVAYYLLATLLWLGVLAVHFALLLLLLLLEDFPWFELLQRVGAPDSLHSGVRFRPLAPPSRPSPPVPGAGGAGGPPTDTPAISRHFPPTDTPAGASWRFTLDLPPAALGPCFARHAAVVATLLRHCSSSALVHCLALGRHALPTAERDVLLDRPPDRSSQQQQSHTLGEFWTLLVEGIRS